tara:strand:- start:1852 stop:2277 length:426 start_codon:yes stop_codon:yes gene_type:complete
MRLVPVAGDGNCFFHSIAYGLKTNHKVLREMCALFVRECPDHKIQDAPVADWIRWESERDVMSYSKRMRQNGIWGGAIEISCLCHMLNLIIEVYVRVNHTKFRRIARFEYEQCHDIHGDAKPKIIKICYTGAHFDALVDEP